MRNKTLRKIIAGFAISAMLLSIPVSATPMEADIAQGEDTNIVKELDEDDVSQEDAADAAKLDEDKVDSVTVTEEESDAQSSVSLFSLPVIPPEFVGWTEVSGTSPSPVTNQFTRDGVTYTATTRLETNPFVANTIVNESTGESNTYVFLDGSANTSDFYYRTSTNPDGERLSLASSTARYFTKVDASLTTIGKYIESTDGNFAIIDIFEVLSTGIITRSVTITNIGTQTYTDFAAGVQLDTELNSEDWIPIYAIGNGGYYITDDDITLYSEPVSNVSIYAIGYRIGGRRPLSDRVSADAAFETELLANVDTAIDYEATPVNNFVPGTSASFSWQERVFVAGEQVVSVQATYVDTKGNTLQPSSTITGITGESYTITPPNIANYEIIDVIGNATGTFGTTAQTVQFVFREVLAPGTGAVIIDYVDADGNEISPSERIVETTGTQQTIVPKEIENYTFVEAKPSLDVVFTNTYQTLTLVYADNTGSVEVTYVDRAGETIQAALTLTGTIGDKYTVERIEINGYTFVSINGDETGTFEAGTKQVQLVYEANINGGAGSQFSGKQAPQTGDSADTFGIVLVMLVAANIIAGIVWKRKRRNKISL